MASVTEPRDQSRADADASPAQSAATGAARGVQPLLSGLAALILFGIFALIMTWPLATGLSDRLISWGDPVFQAWTMAWDVHAWRTDPLHVFDANVFYPYRNTLAYSDHLFGQAALVAPVLLTTKNAILADNIAVLLAYALSGFGMYLLVVDLTGNRFAGLAAGFAYAFAPARMSHLEHLHLASAQWLPLAVLAARRALIHGSMRWAAALGLFVLLQGLFGVYYFYFMVVLLGVVIGSYLVWRPARRSVIATGQIGIACAIAAALLLPTLLPYQRVHDDLGIERTEAEVSAWRAIPGDYLAVSTRNRLYGDSLGQRYGVHLERHLFPGLILIALALLGLFNRRLTWERWMLAAIALVSIVLSFGLYVEISGARIPLPYRALYDLVPGFRAIRVPARLGLLALVGMAGLAGLGADLLMRGLISRRPPGSARLLAPALAMSVLLAGMFAEYTTRIPLPDPLPATLAQAQRPDYAWMSAHPAPAIEFPMGDGPVASAWPNFWSTLHWNQVVNGYSGLTPPVYIVFRDLMRSFPSADTVRLLQGMGVRTVVYHSDPAVPPRSDPFLQGVVRFGELRQVVPGPDYVFELAPDPWMWDLAEALPAGADVDLPDLELDPATFGMLAAILQRSGHTVYGSGTLDYWALPPAPATICYAIAAGEQPPANPRFGDAACVDQVGHLTLFRSSACTR